MICACNPTIDNNSQLIHILTESLGKSILHFRYPEKNE